MSGFIRPTLHKSEIAAALLFVSLIVLCTLFVLVHRTSEREPDPWRSLIRVRVKGAVGHPGIYLIDAASPTVGELKKQLSIDPDAEFPLSEEEVLVDGQVIQIEFPFVTVRITGAVQEETLLRVRRGDRIGDHFDEIPFSPEADKGKIRNRKATGKKMQTISVPAKKILR